MKRFAAIICLMLFGIVLLFGIAALGQPVERRVADSLLSALAKASGPGRVEILNRLAQFYIFKPGEEQVDFDSARRCLAEARSIDGGTGSTSLGGQLLLTESYLLREEGRRDSAIARLEEAIGVLGSGRDPYYLGKVLFELSGYFDYNKEGELPKKIGLVERSTVAFEETNAFREKGDALMMLGDLYNLDKKPAQALAALHRALAAYQRINYKALQGVYILMGRVADEMNDNKQAFSYKLLALKTAESCDDSTMQLCQINMQLALEYGFSGQYETSLKYYKRALAIALGYRDRYAIAGIVWGITRTYAMLDRPEETLALLSTMPAEYLHSNDLQERVFYNLAYVEGYLAARQYEKVKPCLDVLLSVVKEVPHDVEITINREAASYYFGVGDYPKARYYLALNMTAGITPSGRSRAADFKLLYEVDSAQGDYRGAFYHLRTYNHISDSLFGLIKARQFQQLEVEYETAKKTDSLKSKDQVIGLLTQRNGLQQTTLKQSNLIKNISIAGAIVILIFFILLYRQLRVNQKSNRIITQKNGELAELLTEKEWWLREVHHRVKNNLHTIICLLESQAVYLEDDALKAIEKSQHRIYAMSLIHQKLYQNDDLHVIDMSVYLEEFIGYLKESFDTQKIGFILQLEPVQLNLQQAIPVALIINEAVTNSIKYAFVQNSDPTIRIRMTEAGGRVKLVIMDNGCGFDPAAAGDGKSLGMQLIKGLGKELNGTVRIESRDGVQFTFEFEKEPLTDH